MELEWKSAGAQLPPEWKTVLSDHNRRLLGKRGLGRYAWCVAAEVLLCLPPEELRELAAKLRDESESDPESFAEKWNDREAAARTVAPKLLAALNEALRSGGKQAISKHEKKR